MLDRSDTIALLIGIPSLVLLLLVIGLYLLQRIQLLSKNNMYPRLAPASLPSQNNSGAKRQSISISPTMNQNVQRIVQNLSLGNWQDALELISDICQKKPELWSLVRQQIASLTPSPQVPFALHSECQSALTYLSQNNQQRDLVVYNTYAILMTSALNLNTAPAFSLNAADIWTQMGYAYEYMAILFPHMNDSCQEAALHCYTHSLNVCRKLHTDSKQIRNICRIGSLLRRKQSREPDALAYWHVVLDYYEQAENLLKNISNPFIPELIEIYSAIGNSNYALFQIQPGETYLRRARDAYMTLDRIYQQNPPADQLSLQNLKENMRQISTDLQHIPGYAPRS